MKLCEMDKSMKTACMEEITHLICDADKKVNISDVSNNWNISHRDSETLLLEWIEINKNQSLSKEFLIRGVEKNGNCVITVLAENKLDAVQKKFDKFCYSLYSVELASKSNANRLHVAKLTNCKWINLPLKHVERDVEVKPLPIQHVEEPTTSKKNVNSMFSSSKQAPKTEVKQETESVDVKPEKETPKKQSPKKKEPNKTPKMASGKASIASFFSKPSSAASQLKKKDVDQPAKKEVDQAVKKEVDHPTKKEVDQPTEKEASNSNSSNMFEDQQTMEVDESEENVIDTKSIVQKVKREAVTKNNKKRSIIDVDDDVSDEIPGTPQESKKARKSMKKAEKSKRTRIMKMEDSSDDDDNHDEQLKLLASPVKEKENKTPPKKELAKATERNVRGKAKKTITRTFKDEFGYLVTKTESVDCSCSEEENDIPPVEPVKQVEDVSAAEGSEKTTKKKKISPPKTNSKQGSILSFFSKK